MVAEDFQDLFVVGRLKIAEGIKADDFQFLEILEVKLEAGGQGMKDAKKDVASSLWRNNALVDVDAGAWPCKAILDEGKAEGDFQGSCGFVAGALEIEAIDPDFQDGMEEDPSLCLEVWPWVSSPFIRDNEPRDFWCTG